MPHSDCSSNMEETKIRDAAFTNHSESRKEGDKFDFIYDKKLQSPILGQHYQLNDLSTSCIPFITLDTSLLHIPVYAHLKIYDIKPVRLPELPPILSSLKMQHSSDQGTVRSKSSREISSTARLSEEDGVFASCSARNSIKITNKKCQM